MEIETFVQNLQKMLDSDFIMLYNYKMYRNVKIYFSAE